MGILYYNGFELVYCLSLSMFWIDCIFWWENELIIGMFFVCYEFVRVWKRGFIMDFFKVFGLVYKVLDYWFLR